MTTILEAAGRPGAIAPATPLPAIARTARVELGRAPLPPIDRPHAELTILDVTKWFGETSGGVRTYLTEKARYEVLGRLSYSMDIFDVRSADFVIDATHEDLENKR